MTEEQYKRMTEAGAKAWADVPDAGKWVRSIRGGDAIDRIAHLERILEAVKKAPYLPLSVAELIERLEKEGEAR